MSMILKGSKLAVVYMGTIWFIYFFNRSIQYSRSFLNKAFCSHFKLFVCFVVSVCYSSAVEDQTKCERGGGPPRLLNTSRLLNTFLKKDMIRGKLVPDLSMIKKKGCRIEDQR